MPNPGRNDFDPYKKISSVGGSKYQHKVHLEDFWANAVDENEIRKRLHSRLPLKIIRTCNIFKVPDQMEEDPNVMRKGFNLETIAELYDWKKKEITYLEALPKPILDFKKWWIERKLEKLVAPANGFTYRPLGHRPLRDIRSGQISEGTIEERGTSSEYLGAKKGKEIPREKHPRIVEFI